MSAGSNSYLVELLEDWETSIVSSKSATAVCSFFRVAVIFVAGQCAESQFTCMAIFLAVPTFYRAIAFFQFLNCNSAVQQKLKIVYRVHFIFLHRAGGAFYSC